MFTQETSYGNRIFVGENKVNPMLVLGERTGRSGDTETGVGVLVTTAQEEMLAISHRMCRTPSSRTTKRRPGAERPSPIHTLIVDLGFRCFKLQVGRNAMVSSYSFPSLPDHCLALHPDNETTDKRSHTKAGCWLITDEPRTSESSAQHPWPLTQQR